MTFGLDKASALGVGRGTFSLDFGISRDSAFGKSVLEYHIKEALSVYGEAFAEKRKTQERWNYGALGGIKYSW